MDIIFGIDQLKTPPFNPVVTLGNFDGVHLGHQRIFKRVKEEAKKMKLIEKSGIEKVICIEFSLAFAEISPSEFVRILAEKVKVKKIIVGYNYRFGKDKSGDVYTLNQECKLFNIPVEVMEALIIDQTIVSSSKIRELITEGEVEKASKFLGRDYLIVGRVVKGSHRGHTIGFPTANLEVSDELYPKTGVYAVEVIWNDQFFKGLANVGFNPTFTYTKNGDKGSLSLEVHILNFKHEIYGETIQINFKKRIRDEIRFDSPTLLMDQIKKDIQWAQDNVF